MESHILSDRSGNPYGADSIRRSIERFRPSYRRTVHQVIEGTNGDLSYRTFSFNAALVLSGFGMARRGPFEGVTTANGRHIDPHGRIEACWTAIGKQALASRRKLLALSEHHARPRLLVEIPEEAFQRTANELWGMFKEILPCCMGRNSLGIVGASKVLFSAFPELALPVDNAEWRFVFQTVDWGDVLRTMREDIKAWEASTRMHLDRCDPDFPRTTLPAVYNVMAMEARPQKSSPTS